MLSLFLVAGASQSCSVTTAPSGTTCQQSNTVTVSATASGGCSPSATDSDTINFNRICRPAANTCDAPESCNAGSCPANAYAPSGTLCGNAALGL